MIHQPEKENHNYFLQLFNGIADAVLISECDLDGKPGSYIEVNNVGCTLLGYDRQEILQISPNDINRVALEEKDNFKAILETIRTEGKVLFRTDLRHRNGHWIPVEISSQLFNLAGKNVYFSVARDITMRERYESSIKTLVHSTVGLTGQKCLEEIVRNLCDWLDVDGAGIGLFSDNAVQVKACFHQGQLKNGGRLPLENSPFIPLLQGQFYSHTDKITACSFTSDDPPQTQASTFIGCPMHGHNGQIIGAIYAFSSRPIQTVPHVEELLSVIATRAAAECERIHYVRELSHSEEMLRTLFNSTAEAIVGIDMKGVIVFCNPSTVNILGYNHENDLIGQRFWKMVRTTPNNEQTLETEECPFISSIVRDGTISSEDGFFSAAGHQIPVEYWGHPMHRDSELIGGVVTFIDISRRKTLEKQLQHSQRMEAIGTLTGGIAHDFNNILTVISGYVGLLKTQYADQTKLISKIMKIGEAAERGSKLTHGLLAYSRKKSEPSTPVEINQLVLNVQELFGRIIGEGIEKRLYLCADQLIVLADSSQLEQVLVNLATNARDAMQGGGVLTMRTEKTVIDKIFCQRYGYGDPGQYILITVEDTGEGIPREIQQKIFDPFFTTKDTGKGTGLGLAMAWGIVKQHKGYILVDSEACEGSRFKIYLPQTEQPLSVQAATQNNAELPGGHETILLVEDDLLVRESTQSILCAVGYKVTPCDCAEAALNYLDTTQKNPDLILSDVVMPGMKGPEFYQQIRKRRTTPVVFMSGHTFDSLHELGMIKDKVLLLNKPLLPFKLLSVIRQELDKI